LMIFPLGRYFKPPSDKLGHKVAQLLLTPSQTRDRLTEGLFISSNENDSITRLEDALIKSIKAEHLERRLKKELQDYQPGYQVMEGMLEKALQQNIITEQEASLIRDAETARWAVIQVDDFDLNLNKS
jgi:acyl-CoA dehydrogenase